MFWKTKKIAIPKDNAQEVTELESWTVTWTVSESVNLGYSRTYNKAFIKEADALEFRKQLIECAKFINGAIRTDMNKN
tara:strand:- start:770 stop:1003 length:234 start_codon:yes stop_codon:yes gene_type:complete